MSDLISRSELLSIISNMSFDFGNDTDDTETIIEMVSEVIKKQSTAYDISRVVEELKKKKQNALEVEESIKEYNVWNDAIEIVKQGVVSDDVCEWKKQIKTCDWQPSCETNSALYNVADVDLFKFCPYCGKKIKIKAVE